MNDPLGSRLARIEALLGKSARRCRQCGRGGECSTVLYAETECLQPKPRCIYCGGPMPMPVDLSAVKEYVGVPLWGKDSP
jgi:hypothetical protein